MDLPIDDVLSDILDSLRLGNRLILAAPPGAGKTTKVPLALMTENWATGRILLLEPRRIAARMAAERMASSLGEKVGQRVGLSTRVDTKISAVTKVEVITDGLLTRRLLNDPELKNVSAILFDEFHERRLNMDLGLALTSDIQEGLREDLRVVIMSATLDTSSISQTFKAPIIASEGRAYPVETHYLAKDERALPVKTSEAVRLALLEQSGNILVFLPGQKEIRQTQNLLNDFGEEVMIAPLYGGLSPQDQDSAVKPPPEGRRKVVLSTDIAESSLTIDGVRVVIDTGYTRIAEYDPVSATQTLQTRRASLANIDQRRGRAGRVTAGVCYRLWTEPSTKGLLPQPVPEILNSDLKDLLLTLSEWGVDDPAKLSWIDPPPVGRIASARDYLINSGIIQKNGCLTEFGKRISYYPLSVDMAILIEKQNTEEDKSLAAEIAVVLSEQGLGGQRTDLREKIQFFRKETTPRARILKSQAQKWAGKTSLPTDSIGRILLSAWPDRLAKRRGSAPGQFLLASGRAAYLDPDDLLAHEEWLVTGGLTGSARNLRMTSAAPITEREAMQYGQVEEIDHAVLDISSGKLKAFREKRIGAIALSKTQMPPPDIVLAQQAFLDALKENGLTVLPQLEIVRETQIRARYSTNDEVVDLLDSNLISRAEEWWLPVLGNPPRLDRPSPSQLRHHLMALLDWSVSQGIQTHCPLEWTAPSGRHIPINYLTEGGPRIEVRVQEVYGLNEHPCIGKNRVPLLISLTSPARRSVALTKDLSAFWRAGYRDMAKDMRARYPKHDWPEDPANALPHEGRTKANLKKNL